MNNENIHPVLTEPPLAHALHHWRPEEGILAYEYNGVNVLEVSVPLQTDLGYRHGSDGSMQSVQYIQQVYLASETLCRAVVTVRLHESVLNVRPCRADRGQAVLGTAPGLLSHGTEGMYDPEWDLLIDWHGRPWRWLEDRAVPEKDGFCTARFETWLCMSSLFINLRPWYYSRHLGYSYYRPWLGRTKQDAVAGWCSWEAWRREIDIGKVRETAEFLGEKLAPYGLRYLQVDDGYQAMPLPQRGDMTMAEGWMHCDDGKFPDGHPSIVRAVRDSGLIPGIWVNANITNPDFVRLHPEAVLWKDGEPMRGEWIDYLCTCDPETLRTHIEPLFRALADAGYRYIKIDAIRHLLFDGLHECVRLGKMSNDEAQGRFRAYLEATVRGMGKDVFYLASWGEMHEVIGLADACRISMDANPTWAGIRMQLFESARWYHTQRILFLNDPDHVCVRGTAEWVRSVLSLISLSGQLYMISDAAEAYDEERLELLRRTLPPLQTMAGETGPLRLDYPAYTWTKLHGFAVQSDERPVAAAGVSAEEAENIGGWASDRAQLHPFSSLWSFALAHHGLRWRVMLRVATSPLREGMLPLENLALDPERIYVAFDFWEERFLGEVRGTFPCRALELGTCQAAAFYEKPEEPCVIASNRHVSMDAVSILRHSYEDDTLELLLEGVPGDTRSYWVYVPEGLCGRCPAAEISGGRAALIPDGPLVRLEVCFAARQVSVRLCFALRGSGD